MANKLRMLRSELLTAPTLPALNTAINDFFAAAGEAEFVSAHFQIDGSTYAVLILYTES